MMIQYDGIRVMATFLVPFRNLLVVLQFECNLDFYYFCSRLLDVVHSEKKLYLVFEYLNQDLKKYLDKAPPGGFTPALAKVIIMEIY